MMLLLRLAGFRILALNAERKNTRDLIHHVVNGMTCSLIFLHILVRHNSLIDLGELLVLCRKLLLVGIILGGLVLI